jgi:hypothetical protein
MPCNAWNFQGFAACLPERFPLSLIDQWRREAKRLHRDPFFCGPIFWEEEGSVIGEIWEPCENIRPEPKPDLSLQTFLNPLFGFRIMKPGSLRGMDFHLLRRFSTKNFQGNFHRNQPSDLNNPLQDDFAGRLAIGQKRTPARRTTARAHDHLFIETLPLRHPRVRLEEWRMAKLMLGERTPPPGAFTHGIRTVARYYNSETSPFSGTGLLFPFFKAELKN